MLIPSEIDKKFAERALKSGGVTPLHSAAEAGMDADGPEGTGEAEQRRERVQHLADPYPPDLPEVDQLDCAEVGKRFNQAFDTPDGYPPMRPVDPERFRRPPATAGHAAYSTGYEPPLPLLLAPAAGPGLIARPLMTDGQPEVRMSTLGGSC